MYKTKTHKMEDRIVSLHQPWARPIVRGKTGAPVEFGAKVCMSLTEGYARNEELSWNSFNESATLIVAMERYKEQIVVYPERGLADKIYRMRGRTLPGARNEAFG